MKSLRMAARPRGRCLARRSQLALHARPHLQAGGWRPRAPSLEAPRRCPAAAPAALHWAPAPGAPAANVGRVKQLEQRHFALCKWPNNVGDT